MHIFNRPNLKSITDLLKQNGLPVEDLAILDLSLFLGCGDETDPHGIVGLEVHGQYGLLRSLVVRQNTRNSGYGKNLVSEIEKLALLKKVKILYLLTNTAEKFFARLNYEQIERADVPQPIRNTQEFTSLCPDSAVVMRKFLNSNM